jgi:hypothetical protein
MTSRCRQADALAQDMDWNGPLGLQDHQQSPVNAVHNFPFSLRIMQYYCAFCAEVTQKCKHIASSIGYHGGRGKGCGDARRAGRRPSEE